MQYIVGLKIWYFQSKKYEKTHDIPSDNILIYTPQFSASVQL